MEVLGVSRTVVYEKREHEERPVVFGPGGAKTADGYVDKLIKYVPAEVVAFFAPAAALAGGNHALLVAALAAGVVGTPGYLWYQSRHLPPSRKPLPHFFVVATVAFVAWAVATSREMATVLHLTSTAVAFILAVTVLFIPLLDAGLALAWSHVAAKVKG